MMTDQIQELPEIEWNYAALPGMLRKYDKFGRKKYFTGNTVEEFVKWKKNTKQILCELLGFDKLETSSLRPVIDEVVVLPEQIRREHIRIQVEPDIYMTMYLLIPERADCETEIFICPPGHNGAGKYSVVGVSGFREVTEKIEKYNYDYGWQLAKMGYVVACPDCRGFGERREELVSTKNLDTAMRGDCYQLAHMGEPLGIPVAGMLTWDLMRLIDYLQARGEWNCTYVNCAGFSGGGMQTLWLAVMDERVNISVISGYMYGYRDALLRLNSNCSCNYVPHLWEYFDMGDIASLIAPHPLLIQSCRDDRLNGPRGIVNAIEQVHVIKKAYELLGKPQFIRHEICDGVHQWHGEHLEENLNYFMKISQEKNHE